MTTRRFEKYGSADGSGLNLVLASVSQSYYNWANYSWHSENGLLADLGDFGLGQQLWAYSNVSTNAGVIAAQTPVVYSISLTDFTIANLNRD